MTLGKGVDREVCVFPWFGDIVADGPAADAYPHVDELGASSGRLAAARSEVDVRSRPARPRPAAPGTVS